MFKLPLLKKPSVIVEIGNDWLKVLENQPSPSGRVITKVICTKLAHIQGSVAAALLEIFNKQKIDKQAVFTYIPRHLVTVRILEFPSTDFKEIDAMVDLQVGKQTPYSKEEIISAHKILDTEREGYTKVMLVIARRNIVSERVETLQKAGIGVTKVGLSSEGAVCWFNRNRVSEGGPTDKRVILLDIDSNYSDFMVLHGEQLVFTRNILFGINHFLEAHVQWQDKFIDELKRSIELYRSEEKDGAIEKLFLSGTGKNIEKLDVLLASRLDIPVEQVDFKKNIRVKEDIDLMGDKQRKSVSLSALIGFGLKEEADFDLTPPELKIKKLMEQRRRQVTVTGILCISLVMMVSLLLLIFIYHKKSYLSRLEEKIAAIKKEASEVEKMQLRTELIEKRLNAQGSSLNILYEIHRLMPRQIYLTYITIEEKEQMTVRGRASAMSDVFKLVTTLEESPILQNVKTTYATTKREGDTEYADFEIVCVYEER